MWGNILTHIGVHHTSCAGLLNTTRKPVCLAVVDRWMWFMSSGQHVQPTITVMQRVSVGIPVLGFSALPISIAGFQPSTVNNLVQETTRRTLRTIPTFISLEQVGIRMLFGDITLQRAESNMIKVCM
jgi:hypothetical protein